MKKGFFTQSSQKTIEISYQISILYILLEHILLKILESHELKNEGYFPLQNFLRKVRELSNHKIQGETLQ